MESDRELTLLRQAIFDGKIDLSNIRLLDRKWWLGVQWKLDELARQRRVEYSRWEYDLHLRLLDYRTGQDNFKVHWTQAEEVRELVRKDFYPWVPPVDPEHETKTLVDDWYSVFGGDTPEETEQRIKASVDLLAKMREEAKADPVKPGLQLKKRGSK